MREGPHDLYVLEYHWQGYELSLRMQSLLLILLLSCFSAFRALNLRFGPSLKKTSAQNVQALKNDLTRLSRGTSNGVKASPQRREEIQNVIDKLNKQNKVRQLTKSPLIDGSWDLLYTTNEGSSAGKIGPFVGKVEQNVRLSAGVYENVVRLPGFSACLTATWENVSETKWRVLFKRLSFSVLGFKIAENPLEAVGIWRMTYLDEDIRILTAAGNDLSKGALKENYYVLARRP